MSGMPTPNTVFTTNNQSNAVSIRIHFYFFLLYSLVSFNQVIAEEIAVDQDDLLTTERQVEIENRIIKSLLDGNNQDEEVTAAPESITNGVTSSTEDDSSDNSAPVFEKNNHEPESEQINDPVDEAAQPVNVEASTNIEEKTAVEETTATESVPVAEAEIERTSESALPVTQDLEMQDGAIIAEQSVDDENRIRVKEFSIIGVSNRLHPDISQEIFDDYLKEQKLKHARGFVLSELSAIAKNITQRYREAGFVLAQVILPEQDITQGNVAFQVLEGYLENISINGESSYEKSVLTKPFHKLVNTPLNNLALEAAMLQVRDYPGLQIAGVLKPGETPGSTALVLDIKKEKKIDTSLLFDNYGTEFTGRHRVWAGINYNNPSGVGDRIGVNLVRTEGPDGAFYGSLGYHYPLSIDRPIINGQYLVGFEYSRNSFQLGQHLKELKIKGISNNTNLYAQKTVYRTRSASLYSRISYSRKHSSTEQLSNSIAKDDLSVGTISVSSDRLNINDALSYQFSLMYHRGVGGLLGAMPSAGNEESSRIGGSGETAGGTFNKLSFNYTQYHAIDAVNSFVLRLNGQISNDLLVSMEQMPLGGANSVRAYPTSEFLFDTVAFISAEWKTNITPFYFNRFPELDREKEKLELALFMDMAAGYLNDPMINEIKSTNIKGVGIGLLIQNRLKNSLSSRIDIAKPIGSVKSSNTQSIQVHFNMAYQF